MSHVRTQRRVAAWAPIRVLPLLCMLATHDVPAQSPATPRVQPVEAVSQDARQVLAGVRDSVVQIRGFFGDNTAQAFHGTGFAVADRGVFVTNYHIVAQKVHYPERYRLEYRSPGGRSGALEVLAIDVRHDLAVVRADGHAPASLRLEPTVPSKGDRAYAVGYPLDVGLTITEGVSNGRVEDSFDPRIHYSGAINSGMSGGPALDDQGAVIGVNVSGYRFSQLVSFLVPATHAVALAHEAAQAPADDAADLRDAVRRQLTAHARDLLAALDGPMPTQTAAGYALPARLAPFIDCSASANPTQDDPVQQVVVRCNAKAGLYVEQGHYTGDLHFTHHVATTTRLDAWRFANHLTALSGATGAHGHRRFVGPFACDDDTVALAGFDASVLVCARSHRRLEGLYDFTVRATSLNQATRGFASHLDMYGVGYAAGLGFIERYLRAMRWQP